MYSSRFSRAQERRNMRKATLLILATLGILIAVAVLAIPVLTRTALFMGSLNSKNVVADKNDLIPPGSPQISIAYAATNSATQTISGLAEPGSTVYLTQNTQTAGNVVADTNGEFQFENITLNRGDNVFVAVAMDQSGNKSQNSASVHLYFSNDPPKLDITFPEDHESLSGPGPLNLKGNTQNVVHLSVNDRTIILDSNGHFNTNYSLNTGDNVLVFIATDAAGNETRKELTVTYNP